MNRTDDLDHASDISDNHRSTTVIFDSGTVRAGALSPAFPLTRRTTAQAGDTSKVRIGALSPAFPTVRTS